MPMCKNVGPVDRTIRAVIGIGAIAAAFTAFDVTTGNTLGVLAVIVGAIMLGTAAFGMCPLYVPLKLSTCKARKS